MVAVQGVGVLIEETIMIGRCMMQSVKTVAKPVRYLLSQRVGVQFFAIIVSKKMAIEVIVIMEIDHFLEEIWIEEMILQGNSEKQNLRNQFKHYHKKQFETLNTKLNQILRYLQTPENKEALQMDLSELKQEEEVSEKKKTTKKTAKKKVTKSKK